MATNEWNGDWEENRKMVLYRLNGLDANVHAIRLQVAALDKLAAKAVMLGATVGAIVTAILMALARHFIG